VRCQVKGGSHFRPTFGSKTPEPIHLKFSSLITSPVRPDTQNVVAAENAGWVGTWVKLYPRVLSFHFWLLTRSQLTIDFRSMHPKTCFGGGSVPFGSVCTGVKSSFLPPPPTKKNQWAD